MKSFLDENVFYPPTQFQTARLVRLCKHLFGAVRRRRARHVRVRRSRQAPNTKRLSIYFSCLLCASNSVCLSVSQSVSQSVCVSECVCHVRIGVCVGDCVFLRVCSCVYVRVSGADKTVRGEERRRRREDEESHLILVGSDAIRTCVFVGRA